MRQNIKLFPVSFSQQRLWILDQLEPGNAAYHIPVCLRLTGPLLAEALARSVRTIVARHEALRTTFDVRDGLPVQLVEPSCRIALSITEISSRPGGDLEAEAYVLAREEILKPFNLSKGPLIRATLLRLSLEHHILVITMHHIVSDGWSAELLVNELAEHYAALSTGRTPALKPLELQYSEFSILQRHLIATERIELQLAFWRKTLAGAPALHKLPCDHARPEQLSYAGATHTLRLGDELIADLQRMARQQRTTFFTLLAAAFQVLLFKFSKQKDILVGIPVTGRSIPEAETLIGLFVNTVVLRTSFSENPTFAEVLSQVRDALLDAMSNQDAPFERIVDAVRAPRGRGYNPLFQIMFSTFRAAVRSRAFGDLTATPYVVEPCTSRFDLSVNIIEGLNDIWWLQAEYSTELFDRSRIENMLEAYRMLLRTIVTGSHQCLSELLQLDDDQAEVARSAVQSKTPSAAQGLNVSLSSPHALNRSESRDVALIGSRSETSPSNGIEHELRKIWQKHLNTSQIDVDSDFFELGGNSLIAIALIAEVNRTLQTKLPVATLFRNSTIQGLTRRIRNKASVKSYFFPIVETGFRPPFFVICSDYRLKSLSHALGQDQPFFQLDVYTLQEERLLAAEPPFSTVQDIARHFISDIKAVQPSGPYFIGGLCEGAIVALEITHQLQKQGQEIGALIQFDTPTTGYFRVAPWHRRSFAALRGGWLHQYIFRGIRRRVRRMLLPAKAAYVWNLVWTPIRAYENGSRRLNVEITLLRATERIYYDDVAIGWDQLGSLRIFDIPGDHETFLINRGAQRIISRVLDDVQRPILSRGSHLENKVG